MSRNRSTVLLLLPLFALLPSAFSAPFHNGLHEQIDLLSRELAVAPDDPNLLLERAELYRQHEQTVEALRDLEHAASLAPNERRVWLLRARVHADREEWAVARRCADRFLKHGAGEAEGYELRGRIRAAQGDASGAVLDLSRAIRLRRAPPPDLYLERARLQASLGGEQLEQALCGLEQGLRRLGPAVPLELQALELEVELQRYDAALARLDRMLGESRRKETLLARRGAVLAAAGRRPEALESYRAAQTALTRLTDKQRATRMMRDLAREIETRIEVLERGPGKAPRDPGEQR